MSSEALPRHHRQVRTRRIAFRQSPLSGTMALHVSVSTASTQISSWKRIDLLWFFCRVVKSVSSTLFGLVLVALLLWVCTSHVPTALQHQAADLHVLARRRLHLSTLLPSAGQVPRTILGKIDNPVWCLSWVERGLVYRAPSPSSKVWRLCALDPRLCHHQHRSGIPRSDRSLHHPKLTWQATSDTAMYR